MDFKMNESWEILGLLPAIKKSMKLESIQLVDRGAGPFVIFTQKDGSYATAAYDNKRAEPLATCYLYKRPDGQYVVGPKYTINGLKALDSL